MGLRTLLESAISVCLRGAGRSAALLLIMLAAAPALHGQVTTGAVSGIVTDAVGDPIAGARVVLESPALFQPRVYSTNEKGEYRALLLPVGNYVLRVSAPGKLSKVASDLRVGVGANLPLPFVLRTPRPAESSTVEVIADMPGGSDRMGGGGCGWGPAFTDRELLPMDASFQRTLVLSAGVTGTGLGTSLRGALPASNPVAYAIDGLDVTDAVAPTRSRQGSQGFLVEPLPMAIEDEQAQLSPLNARYGGTGRVNLVTTSGSNAYAGQMEMELARPAWTADPASNDSEELARGFQAVLSGPIRRDRVWFALGLRRQPEVALPFLQDDGRGIASISRDRRQLEGKVTGMLTDNHVFTLALRSEDGAVVARTPAGTAAVPARQPYETRAWALIWNGILRSNISVEAQLSTMQRDHQRGHDALDLNLKVFLEGCGQHELDLGLDAQRACFRPMPADASSPGTRNERRSFWINDLWTFNSNWSLMGGLRADAASLRTARGQAQEASLQPRLQLKLNPDGKNRDVYQASVATFTSAFPGEPGPGIGSTPLRVPTVTEYLLGYQRNYDTGSLGLKLVRRDYRHEFASPESRPLENAPGGRAYQGFEVSWEKEISDHIGFGGAATLARTLEEGRSLSPGGDTRDLIAVSTLTRRWMIDRSCFALGLLARYADARRGPTKQGQDLWSVDARVTTQLRLKEDLQVNVSLQIENVFNHAARVDPGPWGTPDGSGAQDPAAAEAWRQPPMRGRTVTRLALGVHF